jgi:hypothetical protein
LHFDRAELHTESLWSPDDYHLDVPFVHPDDAAEVWAAAYRVRLKRPWRSFVRIDGQWMVSMEPRDA